MICQCVDATCVCKGQCNEQPKVRITRLDMLDVEGSALCEQCLKHALTYWFNQVDSNLSDSESTYGL